MDEDKTDFNLSRFSLAMDEAHVIPTLKRILQINPNANSPVSACGYACRIGAEMVSDIRSFAQSESSHSDTCRLFYVILVRKRRESTSECRGQTDNVFKGLRPIRLPQTKKQLKCDTKNIQKKQKCVIIVKLCFMRSWRPRVGQNPGK